MKKTSTWEIIALLIFILFIFVSCAPTAESETITTEKIEIPMAVDTKMPTKIFINQNQRIVMYRFDDGYFTCFVTSSPYNLVCFNK